MNYPGMSTDILEIFAEAQRQPHRNRTDRRPWAAIMRRWAWEKQCAIFHLIKARTYYRANRAKCVAATQRCQRRRAGPCPNCGLPIAKPGAETCRACNPKRRLIGATTQAAIKAMVASGLDKEMVAKSLSVSMATIWRYYK